MIKNLIVFTARLVRIWMLEMEMLQQNMINQMIVNNVKKAHIKPIQVKHHVMYAFRVNIEILHQLAMHMMVAATTQI